MSHSKNKTESKSLQRSPAVGDFYVTGIEIWVGFGPVGITEKKNTSGKIFSSFRRQKKGEKLKTLKCPH